MECRNGCAACCIVPSISSSMPKMKDGKPAGVRCAHLTENNLCAIFNSPLRPAVCGGFKAERLVCGSSREEAFKILAELEGLENWRSLLND